MNQQKKIICIIMALPIFLLGEGVNAEVYKYKDASGRWVYSDKPARGNVKQETFKNNKLSEKSGLANNGVKLRAEKNSLDKSPLKKEDAEAEKSKQELKDAQAKLEQENCRVAKSNLQLYSQGGRIAQVNEKGERVVLGDEAIMAGKKIAEEDVSKYCK